MLASSDLEVAEEATSSPRPWISVVIATYNSAALLPAVIESVRSQEAPLNSASSIEILVVDGGSDDDTLALATTLGARTLDNPFGDPIHAKHIGLLAASSRCVCFLDHDEILVSRSSLVRKATLIGREDRVRIVASSGYQLASDPSASNAYASEFGDPLSLFVYRTPNASDRRAKTFRRRLGARPFPGGWMGRELRRPGLLLEIAATGAVIDRDFFLSAFPELADDPSLVPHLFYLLIGRADSGVAAILEEDPIIHHTASSWQQVRTKVAWRIRNGTNPASTLGRSGLRGRGSNDHKIPTWLFAPYALLVIPAALDAAYLAMSRRRVGYLMHLPLSLYVAITGLGALARSRLTGATGRRFRYDGTPLDDE